MQKILLFITITPLSDPEAVKLWQKTLCESLNLRGRILISRHGLNGTVGGDIGDKAHWERQNSTLGSGIPCLSGRMVLVKTFRE